MEDVLKAFSVLEGEDGQIDSACLLQALQCVSAAEISEQELRSLIDSACTHDYRTFLRWIFGAPLELSGHVLVHGAGDCDQLGLGDIRERKKPTLVKGLAGIRIRDLACGGLHVLCISVEGALFSWGCGDDGALGRSGTECEPGPISLPECVTVTAVSCGDSHSCALSSTGEVWQWGSYRDSSGIIGMQCGDTVWEKRQEPARVTDLAGIVGIASGANHTLAVTSVGTPFAWGSNQFGQLGLQRGCAFSEVAVQDAYELVGNHHIPLEEKRELLLPHRVEGYSEISAVFASSECSFLLDLQKLAYGCGRNLDGQVGTGQASPAVLSFEKIVIEGATWIGGGMYTSAALVGERAFTWGRAEECGHGLSEGLVLQPKPVELPCIRSIRCGMSHMLACSESGEVFVWGCGSTHQLGNRPRDVTKAHDAEDEPGDELQPYCISSKQLAGRRAILADGGAQHSVVLAEAEPINHQDSVDDAVAAAETPPLEIRSDDELSVLKVETSADFWLVQLESIYRHRNPYKLDRVPCLLEKYKGREAILYVKVCKTYNLDPSKFYADPQAWDDLENEDESPDTASMQPELPRPIFEFGASPSGDQNFDSCSCLPGWDTARKLPELQKPIFEFGAASSSNQSLDAEMQNERSKRTVACGTTSFGDQNSHSGSGLPSWESASMQPDLSKSIFACTAPPAGNEDSDSADEGKASLPSKSQKKTKPAGTTIKKTKRRSKPS